MIILVSTSPRRKALLSEAGLCFRSVKPAYAEDGISRGGVKTVVRRHALEKARSVLDKFRKGVLIGADTVVYCKGKIIGKPRDKKDAIKILSRLEGRWHTVYTGVALIDACCGKVIKKEIFVEKTKVRLKAMSKTDIVRYFKRINPLDKAGAYAIQSKKAGIVEETVGSFSNAVGLPVEKLCAKLSYFMKPSFCCAGMKQK